MNTLTDKITCPYCGKQIEISEVIKKQITETALQEEHQKHEKEIEAAKISGREELQKELEQTKLKLRTAEEAELNLRKDKNLLIEEKRSWNLEKQRQLDKERESIRIKAVEEQSEKDKFTIKEKDQVIERLKKSLDEMQRKANVGSQQLQGEVLELDIENALRDAFPLDDIVPIAKGVAGADVKQVVKSPSGKTVCGVILWESKRTKNWVDSWVSKLKEDARKINADCSALVTVTLPNSMKEGMGHTDGVWVCNRQLLIPQAMFLREILTKVALQKATQTHQGRKADLIYEFATSVQFIQQFEAIVEAYSDMKQQVDEERMAFEKRWRQREGQLQRILVASASLYGNIQGIVGTKAIPQLKGLDLPELESGEE